MSKMFFKMGLGLAAAAVMAWPSRAAVTGTTNLSGHVPAVVSQLTAIGSLSAGTNLSLAIGLPLRNQTALNVLLQQIYDPASTNYHKFLTTTEFTAQYGPTAQDYAAVISFAQSAGLTITATHPNRMIVDVSGSVSAIQTAFQINLKIYQHPTENRTFFAPDSEPVVSSSLSILHISGLDNYSIPHPKMIRMSQNPNASPKFGSGPGGSYLGADFRKAYVPGTTLTGAGQNIGLLQFDGFFAGDVASYASLIGLTNAPNIIIVPIDGGVSVPGNGNGEVCLDIEMIFAMAPGVSNIYVYEAPNPSPWVDLLSRMANDNNAKQLSCSWGGGPPDPTAEQIFQQMALQGQSFYNASGDTDAAVNPINPWEFPSESPNITQVGGTTLTTAAGAVYTSETVWNDRFPRPPGYQGSSGGISTFYSIPNWQQGISMASNHGSITNRNVPDVALTADNVWLISDNGQSGASGGTSAAAPLWAGFTALMNQQASALGRPAVGFINPAIYALAKTASYTNVFRDTTTGDNTWPSSPTNFFAVAGYDLCTGLGTPGGTNLINALTSSNGTIVITSPLISAPKPPWGNTLGVMNGGNPNGPWFLFVQDDRQLDTGGITNGWFVTLATANPVGYASDNQIFSTPATSSITLGASWNLIIAVTNYGPSYSSNVFVTDELPLGPGITLVSNSPSIGSVLQLGSTLTWNVGNLITNAGGTLALKFATSAAGTYTNSVVVNSDTLDPNPDDDMAVSTVTIVSQTAPVISGPMLGAGGKFIFSVSGSGGSTVIQASTNLVNWANVYTNTPPFTYTNDVTSFPYRFYRAVTGP
jgi:uncharacterized repeat protein (TIGR01451 family)